MNFENDEIFKSLNPEQQKAALFGDGAYLVIAGPGTGKTHTMTARTHFLVNSGIDPSEILLMTFTKKAASEISERLTGMNPIYANVATGTFHSIAIKILREFGPNKKTFIIDEDEEQFMLLEHLQDIIKPDDKHINAVDNNLLDLFYAAYKQRSYRDNQPPVWSWAEQECKEVDFSDLKKVINEMNKSSKNPVAIKDMDDFLIEVMRSFDENKLKIGKASFDDCILMATEILNSTDSAGYQLDIGYRYISVDEFQDSDKSQLEFVKALVRPHGNIFAVGDDKQSIYCWRGAYPKIFDDFRDEYKSQGLQEISLVRNYRSAPRIIDAVNSAAAARPYKSDRLVATRQVNNNPYVMTSTNPAEAALNLIKMKLKNNCAYSDIAVLFRGHYGSSKMLQMLLTENQIPFVIVGGKSITERLLFKRFRDCLRIISDPSFNIALSNIIKTLPEIGDKAASHLAKTLSSFGSIADMNYYMENDCQILDEYGSPVDDFPVMPAAIARAAKKWVLPFTKTIERFDFSSNPSEVFYEAMPYLAGICGFNNKKSLMEYLSKINASNGVNWLDRHAAFELIGKTTKDLASFIGIFSERYQDVNSWLDALAFDDSKEKNKNGVVLSTIHGAKGKEWDTVIVSDCCTDAFFSKRYMEDLSKRYKRENIEMNFNEWQKIAPETIEIRNLFYVALSRAKNSLAVIQTDEFKLIEEMCGHGFLTNKNQYYITQRERINGLNSEQADLLKNDRKALADYREENSAEYIDNRVKITQTEDIKQCF